MRRAIDAGDHQAAVRQFQRLRAILRADLGVAPDPETVELFERALAAKSSGPDHRERAQTLIARGLLAWHRRDIAEAERLADDARTLAREQHVARELGEACALLGMAAFARGRWHERFRADFEDALHLDREASAFVFDAHLCLAETAMGGGDADGVAAQARELLTVAERAGSAHGQAVAKLLIGEAELNKGRRAEARPWLASAVNLFERANADAGRVLALLRLSEADDAVKPIAEARVLAERSELAPHLMTRVFARTIDAARTLEDKIDALADAEHRIRADEVCGPCSIGLWVNATIASARAGDLARAHRFLADAERLAGMWQGGAWRAAAWEARAFVRLAEGDRAQAAALLREAAPLFAQSGRALDDARCRQEAAQLSG
jgi:tetratricopeptide (TPR) repeat protein